MVSASARREDHFQKNVSKTNLPFRFCKIGLRNTYLLYLFLAEKMVVCCFVCFVLFVATLSDFGLLFLIEALIELRKMLLRKDLFNVRVRNKVPIFCRFTGFAKMQLTLLLDGRSVLDKLSFKMKYKECFISWRWSHTLSIILGGFTALQT